jgi:hypothetical protein
MPKLLLTILMALLTILATALGEAADTSQAARSVVVAIFVVALSVPVSLDVALVVRRFGPHVVNNNYHEHRTVVLHWNDEARTWVKVSPPQASEPERQLEVMR